MVIRLLEVLEIYSFYSYCIKVRDRFGSMGTFKVHSVLTAINLQMYLHASIFKTQVQCKKCHNKGIVPNCEFKCKYIVVKAT